jgi:serine/threonine protein kinase
MGAVYLAHDTQLGRPVALKIPFLNGPDAENARARFLREARAAAALRHPGICPIYDLGEIDGIPYLTMALINGQPLTRKVGRSNPLPVVEALTLVQAVALALQAAHDAGVIHRDLKPANILIDEHGEPIVMDFGLARRDDPVSTHLTQEGQVLGTPVYMPPEQIEGNVAAMGPACDVYSLGVVLYELLTGTVPFQGDLLALASQITLDPPQPPSLIRPEIDRRLDDLCLKALAKKPGERWPSMKAFATAVASCLGTLAPTPAIAQAPSPLRPPSAGPALTLRIEGTPFAYRPAHDREVVTVGRQRRRPDDPIDHGNDLVLRVAANDALSARISRRHFEVRRVGDIYFVVDRSKAGMLLNGQPIPKHLPTPVQTGDRLLVAGVITLAVLLQTDAAGVAAPAVVEVPAVTQPDDRVVIEASLGDMVTLE